MSKESRLAAKARSKQAARKRRINKAIKAFFIILIPVIIALIGFNIYIKQLEKNVSNSSFINEDGTVKGKAAKNYVKLVDYKNINLKRDDLLPTVSELQKAVDSAVDSKKETVKEEGTEIKADSVVYLNYKITVDGKELTDKEGKEAAYTLGGKRFTEDFDKAIADRKVGDDFDLEVKFADDASDKDLAGKKAKIAGKIVSVVVVPALTDDLVAKKFKDDEMKDSSYPATVQGLKDFLANNIYESNLDKAIDKYISENTEAKSYPYFFTKCQTWLADKNYIATMNYYNQMFGQQMYSHPMDILGLKSEREYNKKVKETAREQVKYVLAYQAIFEDAGLDKITDADIEKYVIEETDAKYSELVEQYGKGYLAQAVLHDRTFDYVKTLVKVDGDTSKMTVPDPATNGDASK